MTTMLARGVLLAALLGACSDDGPKISVFLDGAAGDGPAAVQGDGGAADALSAADVVAHPVDAGAPPRPGCPPDLTTPVPAVACPAGRESIEGKISPADRMRFEIRSAPIRVLVLVRGGAMICTLPECAPGACPDRNRIIERWTAENLASQRCVRELVASLGGIAAPETSWLINAFEVSLVFPKILALAEHPHVERIEGADSGAPPP
jgi:hypothetical protein